MSDKFLRSEKQQLLNAIGSELSWGWSPAIDFVSLLESKRQQQRDSGKAPSEDASRVAGAVEATSCCAAASGATPTPEGDNEMDELDAMIRELEARKQKSKAPESDKAFSTETVSILLAGASDIRHVLRTVASLRVREGESAGAKAGEGAATASTAEYHFYFYEPNLRTHCRHLFFLQWLLDSMFSFEELEERVLMFLEVFGNSLVREITAAQARNVANRLLKGLEKETGNLYPLLSFADMKMKERDFLEEQLSHWTRDTSVANIEEQWSRRLRQDMADRYDNRDNLIDWDFVFHLTDYSNLIKFPEYRTWRNTGVAYDVCHINPRKGFTYTYNTPNKTLCHFTRGGQGVYSGDIKNGPFMAMGATTENEHICQRTADGTCKYGNGVVAMHNVRAWLFTLMTGQPWPWADHAFAWDNPANYNYLPPGTPSGVEYKARFPRVRFHFIGLDFNRFLHRLKDQGAANTMSAAFVGTSCTHLLTPEFFHTAMAPEGVVVAETAKFVLDAEDEAKAVFATKISSLAQAAGWERNDTMTTTLHTGQPKPRRWEGNTPTEAQKLSTQRYEMHFQLALSRSAAEAANAE